MKEKPPETAARRELSEETGIHHSKARLLKTKDWLSYDIPVDLILNFGADDIGVKNKNGLPSSFLGKIQI